MRVLVVYASKYGSTQGIAERIAARLREADHVATAVAVRQAVDLESYDAFVVGSAVFIGSWMKEASDFVRRHQDTLAKRPVWLFSSGPIGPTVDKEKDKETTVPKDIAVFEPLIHPRDHRVFFGAFDHSRLEFGHRIVYAMPALRKVMVDGDYRDWPDIDGWAAKIAAALAPAVVS
jgi:menaquinone-dependent protoporphyrinogen oxidase